MKLIFFTLLICPLLLKSSSVELNHKFQSFIQNYCASCHNGEKQKGDIRLDNLNPVISNSSTAQLWQDVLDVLNVGEMPPEEAEERPNDKVLAEAVGLLTDDLFKARKILTASGGEIITRRLNKLEYINSIKSVTGIKIPDDLVPDDENGEDFNTLGWYQTFSPATLETYQIAAEHAVRKILIDANAPYSEKKINRLQTEQKVLPYKERLHRQSVAKYEKALKVPKGADPTKHGFKNKNEYLVAINPFHRHNPSPQIKYYVDNPNNKTGQLLYDMRTGPWGTPEMIRNTDFRAEYIYRARVAHEKDMKEADRFLYFSHSLTKYNKNNSQLKLFPIYGTMDKPQEIEFRISAEDGKTAFGIGILKNSTKTKENTKATDKGKYVPAFWIDWVELEGPIYSGSYKNKRKEILLGKEENGIDEVSAKQIFESFAQNAFRGAPVPKQTISNLMTVFKNETKKHKTKIEALIKPLAVILTSPQFLYHYIDKSHKEKSKAKVKLTGHEMAARLSYMFWKQPPSAELLANANKLLNDDKFLNQSIDKMLNHPKSERFYNEFFRQWLGLKEFDHLIIDKGKYPFFDDARRYSIKRQVTEFIKYIADNELSLANLIDSDFTLVNSTLARFYDELKVDVENDKDQYVKLMLDDKNRHRGGLMGMPIVHMVGSTGDRTNPVERGAWILRKILNDPPAPPPPNVDQLEIKDKNLTIRQRMEKHKSIPQCYSCHKKMDDLGLAMENFDNFGRWNKNPKNITSGLMPDGKQFADFNDMKKQMRADKDKLIESMTEALIAYSLSRESEFTDQDYVENIIKVAKENNYRFKPVIKAFIKHEKFIHK